MRLNNASLIVVPNLCKVCVQILLIALVTVVATWVVQRRMGPMTNSPPIQSPAPTIVHNAVALRAQRKLVVLQVAVSADITKQNERKFMGISLGETRVLLRAPGQIQFVVPLDRLSVDAVKYDPAGNVLMLKVPAPVIDRDIVGVDLSQIAVWRSVGWCRVPSSARELEAEAKTKIICDLIAAADNEWLQRRAEEEARVALAEVLRGQFDEGVTIQTRFFASGAP
jgi:hypothetical protein